jgi:hypothetical protein
VGLDSGHGISLERDVTWVWILAMDITLEVSSSPRQLRWSKVTPYSGGSPRGSLQWKVQRYR